MIIHGYQLGTAFHCLSGNPDIVCRNRSPILFKPGSNSSVSVRCNFSQLEDFNYGMGQKTIQFRHIFVKPPPCPEANMSSPSITGEINIECAWTRYSVSSV